MTYLNRRAGLVVVAIALLAACWPARPTAAQGINGGNSVPAVSIGDKVIVYFDRSKSGNLVYVAGEIIGGDATQFCLKTKVVENVGYRDGVHVDTSEVVRWIPRSSILQMEKTISKTSEPATQPATRP